MKYKKKPVVVEAIQFNGTNFEEVQEFTNGGASKVTEINAFGFCKTYKVSTLEGEMAFHRGYYIIKGVAGEFYPCKPDIFEKTYEVVEENES